MSCEDPLINHESWSLTEDKKLLYTVQNRGLSNWIEIADALGTNRTPFQCLLRFQRSLNASIIKNEWTPPEDEELRNAVAEYGDSNWQLVASTLEGRTGTQCSNRWKKSLNPMRERVGKWAPDEDKRLKIAVKLFGAKNWNKIARFVPGRTQVQCRERWVNCLDPALNMNEWTPEEDIKLKHAIEEHGYQWSKIAACVPPRTDNQCRRRWKQLLPHEVPVLQRARKMKKAAFISNFVDREDERPALTVNDFIAPLLIEAAPEKPNKRQRSEPEHCEPESSSGAVVRIRSRRARKVTRTEKTLRLIDEDDSHADIKANPRLKNKPNIASQETDLSDLNNGEGGGTVDGDNSQTKKKATRKRKQRGNKEQEEMSGSLEADATLIQKTKRPRLRGCHLSSVNNNTEHDAPPMLDPVLTTVIHLSSSPSPVENISSQEAGLLDLDNGGPFDGDNSQIKTKQRKRSGKKEHKKTEETLEPIAILKQKTTKPRSKANRVRRSSIGDLSVPHEKGTNQKTATHLCSSSPSATKAPPADAGSPLVAAITGMEYAMSTDKHYFSREIHKTYKRRKVSCKKGGTSDNDDRQKRSYGEIGDRETIGSFLSKLKKRTPPPDEETIASFFSKLKKRKVE